MRKTYTFIRPYSEQIAVGGFVGIMNFDYKIGDTIEGTLENGFVHYMPSGNVFSKIPVDYFAEAKGPEEEAKKRKRQIVILLILIGILLVWYFSKK